MTTVSSQPVNGSATASAELIEAQPPADGGTETPDTGVVEPTTTDAPPAKLAAQKAVPNKLSPTKSTKGASKRPAKKAIKAVPGGTDGADGKRSRRTALFPASTFEDALDLAEAIYRFGSGQPVRRVSLFDNLDKSPDSGPSRQLVTNSSRYGLTTGSYKAEMLELTADGLQAVGDDITAAARTRARFKCAIGNIEVFDKLFKAYVGTRLPAPAALMDRARGFGIPDDDLAECIDTFTVNTKFIGVLRSISGAERLIDIDTLIGDYLPTEPLTTNDASRPAGSLTRQASAPLTLAAATGYDTACFYITPIGDEGSETRKHADLFMGALIEPTLTEFGLHLVRADKIGEGGMITAQIIEHLVHSRLVVVDLSFHNPNVFYELALRHAVRKPIVQICRAADRLPFDVGQVRTIIVDTTDLYTFVPQMESLKAQIAAQIRKTLEEGADVVNPLSVFAPYFWNQLPAAQSPDNPAG